jgi:hypothetical protein
MTANATNIMPVFVFARRRDIEIEAGLILAGDLIVDIPKTEKPKRRHQQMVGDIIWMLFADAQSGRMPDDAMIWGWPEGTLPANRDEISNDDELMASWAETRMRIMVRVNPRNDGMMQVDSDMRRRMGLLDRKQPHAAEPRKAEKRLAE